MYVAAHARSTYVACNVEHEQVCSKLSRIVLN